MANDHKPLPYYRWRPHPWHGLEAGREPPVFVSAFIEITPFDPVKYEVDKVTGYTFVDRPQRTSSQPPSLYGFIPRTYCGVQVGQLIDGVKHGDGDPLDICVISERPITRAEVVLNTRVVGGIQTTDKGEADDKIVAVLVNDTFWGDVSSIYALPVVLIERLRHYFSTYKIVPGEENQVRVLGVYDAEHAFKVVEAALRDYQSVFGKEAAAIPE